MSFGVGSNCSYSRASIIALGTNQQIWTRVAKLTDKNNGIVMPEIRNHDVSSSFLQQLLFATCICIKFGTTPFIQIHPFIDPFFNCLRLMNRSFVLNKSDWQRVTQILLIVFGSHQAALCFPIETAQLMTSQTIAQAPPPLQTWSQQCDQISWFLKLICLQIYFRK